MAVESVACIAGNADPYQAARLMEQEGVGSLVVTDAKGEPVGIVTDRDLTLRVVASDRDPASVELEDIMTEPLVTADADDDVEVVIRLMKSRGVRRVPLTSEGKLVGIVALDDLIQALAHDMDELSKETQAKIQAARVHGRLDRIQRDVDNRLRDAYERLQVTNFVAREGVLSQIDEVRKRLAKALE